MQAYIRFLIDAPLKLPGGLQLIPWTLYRMSTDSAAETGIKYEVITSDGTRVGSRLEHMFATVGVVPTPGGCNCKQMREILDRANIDWIKENRDDIVAQIINNAKAIGRRAPRGVLQAIVSLALLLERRQQAERAGISVEEDDEIQDLEELLKKYHIEEG
jgi:hypothetical protein